MRYKLLCKCGATCWVPGEEDDETNSFEPDLDKAEWEKPKTAMDGDDCHDCEHEEFECINCEEADPPEDY